MREVRALTGLRGVVALDVVLGHYDCSYVPFANQFIFHDAAVDIFFCLSSFTLCMVYGAGTRVKLDLRRFAVARIARIYPVYLLSLLMMIAILVMYRPELFAAGQRAGTIGGLLSQAFLLAALPVRALMGFWDTPAWSVGVEAFCYAAVFPLVFLASRRVGGWPMAVLVAVVVLLAGADYLVFDDAYQANILGIGYGTAPRELSYWVPILRGVTMFLAGWLAWLLMPRLGSLIGRLTDVTALLFVLVVVLATHGHGERQLVVFVAPFLIMGLMQERSVTAWLLSRAPAVFVGRISYSLYLLHVPVLIAYHVDPVFPIGNALDFYAPFFISMGLAIVSFHCLETPARQLIRTKL